MKKVICLSLAFILAFSLCACGMLTESGDNSNKTPEKSEIEKVHEAIEMRRMVTEATDQRFTTIGDNAINRVSVNITNLEKISDTEYIANGTITKTDVYGTQWKNQFDCKITTSDGEEWSAGSFVYKNDKWTKG